MAAYLLLSMVLMRGTISTTMLQSFSTNILDSATSIKQRDSWTSLFATCSYPFYIKPCYSSRSGKRQLVSSLASTISHQTLVYSISFRRIPGPRKQRNVSRRSHVVAKHMQAEKRIDLPLFPLPLVLFPGAILPLPIFEFRYRIMMHTLLQTDLRFVIVFTNSSLEVAVVGCVGEIIKHERLVDDRFFMTCRGQERFRVVNTVRTKPYLVAEVESFEDRASEEPEDVEVLAAEVESYMKDVIRLFN